MIEQLHNDKVADTALQPNHTGLVRRILVPSLIIVVGMLVLLYPVVATHINNVEQQRVAHEYAELLAEQEKNNPAIIARDLERAREYNTTRARGPILDPWLARVQPDNVDYQEYLSQLASLPTMGRIIIPSAGVDLPILHGTTSQVLDRAVGHLYGSDLPIGGKNTHAVLTGHTGLSNATLFDNLVDVVKGDDILIVAGGEKLRYVVDDIRVVLPNETDYLYDTSTGDKVTLITCTPYGINTHRLLVTGSRADLNDEHINVIEDSSTPLWQDWMLGLLGVVTLIALGLLAWIVFMVKRSHRQIEDTYAKPIGSEQQ